MKDLYPSDLNPIETAIWAAEYVRVCALPVPDHMTSPTHDEHGRPYTATHEAARSANQRVAQLREARGL